MGENSKISWTDHTFNPWIGCAKIGPGCDHCYAEALSKRSGLAKWGAGEARHRTRAANWAQPLKWNEHALATATRPRVFCASLADVFDNEVPEDWRVDLFHLIRRTPNLDWILVTKRIGNAAKMLPDDWGHGYRNVWLIATVVDQVEADRDIPKLLLVPAAIRGLSIEPMLGQIDLGAWIGGLDWVICGCESGHGRRAFDPLWAARLRDQCEQAHVSFFYKQGPDGPPPKYTIETPELFGRRYMQWPRTGRMVA